MKNRDKDVVLAAEEGRISDLENLLQAGGNPNAMGPNSGAIHCAVFNGHEVAVGLLLQYNVDVRRADHQGFVPLHLAASKGFRAICEKLIASGADVNQQSRAGGTALHIAAAYGYDEVVKVLVEAKTDLRRVDNDGNTALSVAAASGHSHIVTSLRRAGAKIDIRNNYGEQPLMCALFNMRLTRIEKYHQEVTDEHGTSKLEIKDGRFFLNGIQQVITDQYTGAIEKFIHTSQHFKYLNAYATIKKLLSLGADVNSFDSRHQYPLHMACRIGEPELLELIIKRTINHEERDSAGAKPIHHIAACRRADGLRTYLDLISPEHMNVTDHRGWTPLHYLADMGCDPEMVDELLMRGADRKARSTVPFNAIPAGVTPADVASFWKDTSLAKMLTQ